MIITSPFTVATNNPEQFHDVVVVPVVYEYTNLISFQASLPSHPTTVTAFFSDSRAATSIDEVISSPSLSMIRAGITIQSFDALSAVRHLTFSQAS